MTFQIEEKCYSKGVHMIFMVLKVRLVSCEFDKINQMSKSSERKTCC